MGRDSSSVVRPLHTGRVTSSVADRWEVPWVAVDVRVELVSRDRQRARQVVGGRLDP